MTNASGEVEVQKACRIRVSYQAEQEELAEVRVANILVYPLDRTFRTRKVTCYAFGLDSTIVHPVFTQEYGVTFVPKPDFRYVTRVKAVLPREPV